MDHPVRSKILEKDSFQRMRTLMDVSEGVVQSGPSQSEEFCHSKKCEINSRHPSILRGEYPPAGWMSPEQRIFMIRARWKNWTSFFERKLSQAVELGIILEVALELRLFRSLLFSSLEEMVSIIAYAAEANILVPHQTYFIHEGVN